MLGYLKDITNFDALFFMPSGECDIHIQSNVYKNKGDPVEGSSIGDKWHVILFQEDEETDSELFIKNFDTFEAIFSDPREYISDMIECGWFGVVSRKTTTSNAFYQDALAKFQEI